MLLGLNKGIIQKKIAASRLLFAKYVVFTLLCCSELYYFLYQENGMWFCNYKEIGWIKAIIGFILVCFFFFTQFCAFINILFDVHKGEKPADFRIGFYSYFLLFIACFISLFFFEEYLRYVIYLFLIGQLLQLLFIIYTNKSYWKSAIAGIFIYLLGTVTLVAALIYFIKPVLCICLIFLIIYIISLLSPNDRIKIDIHIKMEQ